MKIKSKPLEGKKHADSLKKDEKPSIERTTKKEAIEAQTTNNSMDLITFTLRGNIVSLHKLHIKAYNLSLKKKETHNLWIL